MFQGGKLMYSVQKLMYRARKYKIAGRKSSFILFEERTYYSS